jgi:hypothetical protein
MEKTQEDDEKPLARRGFLQLVDKNNECNE